MTLEFKKDFAGLVSLMRDTFVLTGSRYMAEKNPYLIPVSPKTDWDFVTFESSPALANFLDTMKKIDEPVKRMWGDYGVQFSLAKQSTVAVYGLSDEKINLIVKSADTYHPYVKVFEEMTPEFYVEYLWKSGPQLKNLSKFAAQDIIRERLEMLLDWQSGK